MTSRYIAWAINKDMENFVEDILTRDETDWLEFKRILKKP